MRRLLGSLAHLHFLVAFGLLVATAQVAHADTILINNGLAPPVPANLIDHTAYATDDVYVRNVSCGTPNPGDPCASPGDSTAVEVTSEGDVYQLIVRDTSIAEVSGGSTYRVELYESAHLDSNANVWHNELGSSLYLHDFATATVVDGSASDVAAWDSSQLTLINSGIEQVVVYDSASLIYDSIGAMYLGGFGSAHIEVYGDSMIENAILSGSADMTIFDARDFIYLKAFDTSHATIIGRNFAVDGVPVPYGDLTVFEGILTGEFLSGSSLHWGSFERHAGATITLAPIPEPATALLVATGLAGLALRRRRMT